MNQHNILFLITALTDISAILINGVAILDPTNDPKLKNLRRLIGIPLIIVAFILSVIACSATFTKNTDSDTMETGNDLYTEEPQGTEDFDSEEDEIYDDDSEVPYLDDDSYLHYRGHTYYTEVLSDIESFNEAEDYCEYYGGHLAVINDDEENRVLYDYVFMDMNCRSAYFGLTDEDYEGVWKWIDGSPCTYSNWAEGQPDNLWEIEHYALFYYKDPAGTWNDGDFGKDPDSGDVTFLIEYDEDLE